MKFRRWGHPANQFVQCAASEPGMSAILAIRIAKTLFQYNGFTPGPEHLQYEEWEQSSQEPGAVQIEDEAGKDKKTENVDGIADPRIKTVSYK